MSVSSNDRPVGKGQSRTAHTHVGEEIGQRMKQPNNEDRPQRGQPEAEAVEGSALTKENTAQSNTGRTQSRETVSSGLGRVRQASQGGKD